MKKLHSWVIVLSLGLNVLMAGYILGCAGTPQPPHMPIMDEPSETNLSPEKKAMLEDKMREFHAQNKDRFDTIRAKRDEMKDILTAETFDVDAFKAKSKELDELFSSSKQTMVDKMADMAKGMSQDERKVLASYMRHKKMPAPMGPPDGKRPDDATDTPPAE